ncbi:thioester domain-containing protein [Streptomyces specialis]|uniref:thioester domain-containing protein n=1 Tax=Streptomyces specialis TaxID=498367 RepID=UPI00073E54EB|nr:thioester domain-containing protein [Streptomyces specialis]
MKLARGRTAPRLAATALATGLLMAGAIATAGPAAADEAPLGGGATATLEGLEVAGDITVSLPDGGGEEEVEGGLFRLAAPGGAGTFLTYCVDYNTHTRPDAVYEETDWASSTLSGDEDAGRIHWILQHSYPTVDVHALARDAGIGDGLTEEDAAAGTQAAIWQFSDEVTAVPHDAEARALTAWLAGHAEDLAEPGVSLELPPPQVSGQPGGTIGPVPVRTTADAVSVTPDQAATAQGVTVVDSDGEPVTEDRLVADGTELYFSVPEDTPDGSASLTATASVEVPVGRAFTGTDPERPTQTMILADTTLASVPAAATVSWAAPGQPSPSITTEEVCAEGGVEVTATNNGDRPFAFDLAGRTVEVPAHGSESVLVPVADGQAYEIVIDNPAAGVADWVFSDFLDCAATDDGDNRPVPASTGGSGGDETAGASPDLAATGSGTNPALIGGLAAVLLAAGAAALLLVRRRTDDRDTDPEE